MNYTETEKICIGQFKKHDNLFKTTIKDNIEKYRKGLKTVILKDKNGNLLKGVTVKVCLKNHEFKHGAHIFMLDQFKTEEENKAYRALFPEYFNLATIPFYWEGLEPEKGNPRYHKDSENVYRRPSPCLCTEYCNKVGIDAKIHCLFYDKFIPSWLPKEDEEKMKELYEKRFSEIAELFGGGKMYSTEVINEVLSSHAWQTNSVLSKKRDAVEWAFSLAEKYFPNDILEINDGNYIPEIGRLTYHHPYFLLIDAALSKGIRIDKIGIQNHIYAGMSENVDLEHFAPYYDPIANLKGIEIMSEFKKPLEITEISIPTFGEGEEAENLQAEVLKYLYNIWFSSEMMESAVYWNSVEHTAYASPTWNENKLLSGLFHRDLTPKKSALMLKKLFKEDWHTEAELVSDENGQITFCGFHGEYDIVVKDNKAGANLGKKNNECEIIV